MTRRVLHPLKNRRNLLVCLLALASVWEVCIIENAKAQASNAPVEQALIITVPFNGISGSNEVVERLYKLENELIKAIEQARAGEYDGNEIGDTTFTMYAYGPSADKLFNVAQPILVKYRLPPGSRALKRYGKPEAREERISLGTGAAN